MAQRNIKVGAIKEVSGEVNIAGGDIVRGYTAEQVTVLLTQITSTFRPKPFDGRSSYKGLDVFEEEDAELFFGREKLVDDLVSRVKESRTVFITGPSGSGKSSLARAGLLHALKQGAIKNLHSERWSYETRKPGRDPVEELARVASSLAGVLNAGEDIRTKGASDATVLGGIHKSLERHADKAFEKLGENEKQLAHSIFSGLIEIGRGTQDTRRTALFDELIPADTKATDVEVVVQKLADALLITTDEQAGRDTVTSSHEK